MTGFWRCAIYAIALGLAAIPLGRLLARHRFNTAAFPWKDRKWERGGTVYRKIGIHRWHNHLPDMSRVLKNIMPPKALHPGITPGELDEMIQETCVAECSHACLSALGLVLLPLWPGWGGVIFCLLYILLGNFPFILIQRFNRPKLIQLHARVSKRSLL